MQSYKIVMQVNLKNTLNKAQIKSIVDFQTDKFSTVNHTTLNTLVGRQNSIE